MVSSGSFARIAATAASVFPVRGLSASVLNSTSSSRSGDPAARQRFSQPSGFALIAARIFTRSAGSASRRNSASYPPSIAAGGRQAVNPVAPAV